MTSFRDRRRALQSMGLGLAATTGLALSSNSVAATPMGEALVRGGANDLRALMGSLAKTPRRRDFKTVPMILDDPEQWDDAALRELATYKPGTKQVWDNSVLDSPWLNLMRNSLNTQVWSFKHPDFLIASATHGSAHLALYDQATWDKYGLTKLAGENSRRIR